MHQSVTVRKGNKAQFWRSSWINGTSPLSIAPSLYQKSKRKNITVLKALHNNTWITHISPLQSSVEVHEYVNLWEGIHSIDRNEEIDDQITWRWTTNGEYSTKSAYHIQFMGRFKKLESHPSGRQRLNQNVKVLPRSCCNGKSSQLITLPNVAGNMIRSANCAM
jgi:hypothetical protein